MPYTPDSIRQSLAAGAGLAHQSQAQYARLREYAAARQQVVQQRINELSPKALLDPDAAKAYQKAILENAQLSRVLIPYDYPTP